MPNPEKTNWPAIFVAYSNGGAALDICREFGISMPELESRALRENWGMLREKLPVSDSLVVTDFGQEGLAAIERIRENRERNYAIIVKMQEDLADLVQRLRDDKITIIEFKTTRDGVHELERPPGFKDRVQLAEYAAKVFEMSYEALGDRPGGKDGLPLGKGNTENKVVFQINLPEAISQPRRSNRVPETVIEGEIVK